ncbi:hypothetical protein K432DRAFT_40045 [Lepidopterella palustris CBS 459.81]|uniref:Uncharacterized protein n=1 Tax=Lepidopterella palustris CBS 459.81 TaxID=1314670 RepID=A0A8E2JJW9_9PEZI|nr:hypothetical protein K432DRAFT_40045 [Lepidopterella palustris CBS 459.81]
MDMSGPHSSYLTPPRPRSQRERTNSFPISEALECTATEAAIMFAAEKAAMNRRQYQPDKRQRRRPQSADEARSVHQVHRAKAEANDLLEQDQAKSSQNTSFNSELQSSNQTPQGKKNTANTSGQLSESNHALPFPKTSPLHTYSANLTKFIQSRLNSISSYQRLCSDPSISLRQSHPLPQHVSQADELHEITDKYLHRPPLCSTFSVWSSPDENSTWEDNNEELLPSVGTADPAKDQMQTITSTDSILAFYEGSNSPSFLFPATPIDSEGKENAPSPPSLGPPSTIKDITRSASATSRPSNPKRSPSYLEARSRSLTPQSYFHPSILPLKTFTAISPYEGNALTHVYDILVEAPNRVVVEGLAFELLRELKIPSVERGVNSR